MKNWLKTILAFIAGMITMLIIMINLSSVQSDELQGLTLFQDKTQVKVIEAKQVKIFQVLTPNKALAYITNEPEKIYDPNQLTVLIIGKENTSYYDDEKIIIQDVQHLKQIGIFQYESKMGQNTVPVVSIENN